VAQRSKRAFADLRWGEFLVILPLLALIFYVGAQPGMLTYRMDGAVFQALCPPTIGQNQAVCVSAMKSAIAPRGPSVVRIAPAPDMTTLRPGNAAHGAPAFSTKP